MGSYELFSYVYDPLVERIYRRYRAALAAALRPGLGHGVVDLACGTGQNFAPLLERLGGASARLVGVDASPGMLRRARRRIERNGWTNASLVEADARSVEREALTAALGGAPDYAVCTLGLSVLPDWEAVFERFFGWLRPGGQFLILDVYAERRVPQTRWVEWIAGADPSRRVWEPLERASRAFELRFLPGSPHLHGGRVLLATGLKRGGGGADERRGAGASRNGLRRGGA